MNRHYKSTQIIARSVVVFLGTLAAIIILGNVSAAIAKPFYSKAALTTVINEVSSSLHRQPISQSQVYKSDCYTSENPFVTQCDTIRITYPPGNNIPVDQAYKELHVALLGRDPLSICEPNSFACAISGLRRGKYLLDVEFIDVNNHTALRVAVRVFPQP